MFEKEASPMIAGNISFSNRVKPIQVMKSASWNLPPSEHNLVVCKIRVFTGRQSNCGVYRLKN